MVYLSLRRGGNKRFYSRRGKKGLMKITDIHIRNFKSIRDVHIQDIENALILVGQNNTGKTTVLDAIRAAGGVYPVGP